MFHEDGPFDDLLALGLRDLGPGKLWAVSREALPDFLEHVYGLLAPRPPRGQADRNADQGANRP